MEKIVFDNWDYEESDQLYNVGDWVIAKGYDYVGRGVGFRGVIVTQLMDKKSEHFSSGLLLEECDFMIETPTEYGKQYRKIDKNCIVRHTSVEERGNGVYEITDQELIKKMNIRRK